MNKNFNKKLVLCKTKLKTVLDILDDYLLWKHKIFKDMLYHKMFWERFLADMSFIAEILKLQTDISKYKKNPFVTWWYLNLTKHADYCISSGIFYFNEKSILFKDSKTLSNEIKIFYKDRSKLLFMNKLASNKNVAEFIKNDNVFTFFISNQKLLNWDINDSIFKFCKEYWLRVQQFYTFILKIYNQLENVPCYEGYLTNLDFEVDLKEVRKIIYYFDWEHLNYSKYKKGKLEHYQYNFLLHKSKKQK